MIDKTIDQRYDQFSRQLRWQVHDQVVWQVSRQVRGQLMEDFE